jgi:hypothetical protein
MAVIGYDNSNLDATNESNGPSSPAANINDVYLAVSGDVVTKITLYGRNYYGTPSQVIVGIYEVSGGVPTVLVDTATIDIPLYVDDLYDTGTINIPLEAGKTYCVAVTDALGTRWRYFYAVLANSRSNDLTDTPATQLPANWIEDTQSQGRMYIYADVTNTPPSSSSSSSDELRSRASTIEGAISL